MRSAESNFQKFILPAIIGGIFTIAGCIVNHLLADDGNKLASSEVTETRSRDGSVTKRKMEIYK